MMPIYVNGFSARHTDTTAIDFAPYADFRQLRRMETSAKNILWCACEALAQAQLPLTTPKNMALSISLGGGALENTCKFMDSIFEDGDELSSPTAFAGSVHNSTALALSMFLHIQGPCITTGQFDASFAAAWLTAMQFLAKGVCEQALVAVGEDVNPVLAQAAPARVNDFAPFLRNTQGPFERSAAAFILAKQPSAATRFCVRNFTFSRTDNSAIAAPLPALALATLLKTNKPAVLHDVFAGCQFTMEVQPYAQPQ